MAASLGIEECYGDGVSLRESSLPNMASCLLDVSHQQLSPQLSTIIAKYFKRDIEMYRKQHYDGLHPDDAWRWRRGGGRESP